MAGLYSNKGWQTEARLVSNWTSAGPLLYREKLHDSPGQ
uniref:Uncharacterized protein n=1 Tax=Escherichia coli TaxID=562 RepID=A0A3G4RTP9_ECOLX|nr:hypothetical protein D0368_00351 [Escherichia coli]